MVNKAIWKYGATLTIRLEEHEKDRLWKEAESKGIAFSEHIRSILKKGRLPGDLCELLPDQYRERIENRACKVGQEPGEILLHLITHGIPYALDNMSFGF